MRLIIKSPEYYGVAPNYINRSVSGESEERNILEILLKFDEGARVYHHTASVPQFVGSVKERYNQLQGKVTGHPIPR